MQDVPRNVQQEFARHRDRHALALRGGLSLQRKTRITKTWIAFIKVIYYRRNMLRKDVADFVADHCLELAKLATEADEQVLAQILEMAALEAQHISHNQERHAA